MSRLLKLPDEAPAGNRRLEDSLILLRKSTAELELANAALTAANDRLARSIGWDVPEAPRLVTWGAR